MVRIKKGKGFDLIIRISVNGDCLRFTCNLKFECNLTLWVKEEKGEKVSGNDKYQTLVSRFCLGQTQQNRETKGYFGLGLVK
jgi:hypothetical protein